MTIETKFDGGTDVKDKMTGFIGKVTAYCVYYSGTSQVQVSANVDGSLKEVWLPEGRLEEC